MTNIGPSSRSRPSPTTSLSRRWHLLVLTIPSFLISLCSTFTVRPTTPSSSSTSVGTASLPPPDGDAPVVTGVTLKIAFDAGWAVADASEEKSERFTSPSSLDLVHRLRRVSDCVLVGRATVEADDCTLTVRRVPYDRPVQPTRVVLDPRLRLLDDQDYQLLRDGHPTLLCHSTPSRVRATGANVTLVDLSSDAASSDGVLAPRDVLVELTDRRGLRHVMVEGGPRTALSWLRDGLVDRAMVIRAPLTFVNPVPSHMTERTFTDAGLVELGRSGGEDDHADIVSYWSRPGLPWPSGNDDLTSWP